MSLVASTSHSINVSFAHIMRPSISIAIILVNYNSELRTIKCVEEELSRCELSHRIIVVNNAATTHSDELLSSKLNGVVVSDIYQPIDVARVVFIVSNPENSGFARGNNLGVDFVTSHFEVDYLLFSNNDIVMRSDCTIERLLCKLSNLPNVGVIAPKVVGLDGECQSPNPYVPFWQEMVFRYWGRFLPSMTNREVFDQNLAQEGYYYRVMGAFFLAKTKEYISCGKMDSNTFLYGEEVILAERMLAIGRQFYYYPSVEVLHEHGATIDKNRDSKVVQWAMFESLAYYYKTYKGVSPLSISIARFSNMVYLTLQNFYRRNR